jgi:GNAT superfamily N-acetyltransferase
MPSVSVRLATESDLPRLIELYSQLELDPSREESRAEVLPSYRNAFAAIAADPNQQLFVAEAGGRVAGTACLIVMPNLTHKGRPYALIENVVVDASQRSTGIGQALMRHLIDRALSAGCYKVALTSNFQREQAHRFYEKLGFITRQRAFRIDFD